MYAKIGHFIDIDLYKETFESNLNEDEVVKTFWIQQFPVLIKKFADQASKSEKTEKNDVAETVKRVLNYTTEYHEKIENLMSKKNDFLSVRMLLELNEKLLKKYGFEDVWRHQKQIENFAAITLLTKRLKEIDEITDARNRWDELFRGVLAGNIFDSGATAVQELLQNNENFGLQDALQKIPDRPWLIDSFDTFVNRIENGPKHNCAAFFCDNSGVDIVLGVIPFVRELLKRQTKVILCANSEPSLNDVTYCELNEVAEEIAKSCAVIDSSFKSGNLLIKESGQGGCCLNFLDLDENLIDTMIQYKVDLIIIEGMGRSLHTNLNSHFKCDSLKLAVIKNKFLASRLGGNLFDAICKYEGSAI